MQGQSGHVITQHMQRESADCIKPEEIMTHLWRICSLVFICWSPYEPVSALCGHAAVFSSTVLHTEIVVCSCWSISTIGQIATKFGKFMFCRRCSLLTLVTLISWSKIIVLLFDGLPRNLLYRFISGWVKFFLVVHWLLSWRWICVSIFC